jgi:uncharacterized protein YeaO (DUF488 family)
MSYSIINPFGIKDKEPERKIVELSIATTEELKLHCMQTNAKNFAGYAFSDWDYAMERYRKELQENEKIKFISIEL